MPNHFVRVQPLCTKEIHARNKNVIQTNNQHCRREAQRLIDTHKHTSTNTKADKVNTGPIRFNYTMWVAPRCKCGSNWMSESMWPDVLILFVPMCVGLFVPQLDYIKTGPSVSHQDPKRIILSNVSHISLQSLDGNDIMNYYCPVIIIFSTNVSFYCQLVSFSGECEFQ